MSTKTFENKKENYFSSSLCPLLFKIVHTWASCVFGFVVPSLRHILISATPSTAACQASLSFAIFQSLLKFMSIESVMVSNHLILCHPLLLLPSIFPSIRVFYNESTLHIKWPKYWSFNFSISLSNEYSGLISIRIDWFDLPVQETLNTLHQPHSLKTLALGLLSGPPLTFIDDY